MSGTLPLLLVFAFVSYLIGAIPFSYLIPKILLGIDIRQHGSGNPGASNVSRVCGKGYGLSALALDIGKGIIAVLLLQQLGLPPILGFLAIVGHIANPFFCFSGGKGVATSLGVISFFSWQAGVVFVLLWVAVFSVWNIAGLSSLVAISSTPVVFYFFGGLSLVFWALVALTALIYFTHRGNIARLIKGEERKV